MREIRAGEIVHGSERTKSKSSIHNETNILLIEFKTLYRKKIASKISSILNKFCGEGSEDKEFPFAR